MLTFCIALAIWMFVHLSLTVSMLHDFIRRIVDNLHLTLYIFRATKLTF